MRMVALVVLGCLLLGVVELVRFADESHARSSPADDLIQGGLLVGIGILIVVFARRRRP